MDLDKLDFRRDKSDAEFRGGMLHCTRCGELMQRAIDIEGSEQPILVTLNCSCRAKEIEKEEEQNERRRYADWIMSNRKTGIPDKLFQEHRFEVDDSPDSNASKICRGYVKNWEQVKAEEIGIILSGGLGTGKSFYAACIANALIDKGVRVMMTNFGRILSNAMDRDGEWWRRKLRQVPLLIIDDLGTERRTDYALELVYGVIDDRLKAQLPLIITTNLSVEQMQAEANIMLSRIYERILAACLIRISLTGESRRRKNHKQRQAEALRTLLGG